MTHQKIALLIALPCASALTVCPARTRRMMVPFPPGGVNDIMVRLVTQTLSERRGKAVRNDRIAVQS